MDYHGASVPPEWTAQPQAFDTVPTKVSSIPLPRATEQLYSRDRQLGLGPNRSDAAVERMPSSSFSKNDTSTIDPKGSFEESEAIRAPPLSRLAWQRGGSSSSDVIGVSSDPIHSALLALGGTYPIVNEFQRINVGFYKFDGSNYEITLARNSDKLLVQCDDWRGGVRGELAKLLPQLSQEVSGLSRSPSENSLQRHVAQDSRLALPKSGLKQPKAKAQPKDSFAPGQRQSPTRDRGTSRPVSKQGTAAKSSMSSKGPASTGLRRGVQVTETPRKDETMQRPVNHQIGSLLVHMREPLLGDPMVVLQQLPGAARGKDSDFLTRLLCTGRTAQVQSLNVAALENTLRAGAAASIAAFEELFFTSPPDEFDEAKMQSAFTSVELGELSVRQLTASITECWPPGMLGPMRGLSWALRPFLVDWLKRRLRPRLFTQLVVALPDDVLERRPLGGVDGAPSLKSLLLDLTERDLLIAALLATPPIQRSRLYALAVETGTPLPLAFPTLRCPGPIQSDSTITPPELIERNVSVQWDAFDSLLARPSERPMILWLGAQKCGQSGKSQLLRELLGVEAMAVEAGDTQEVPGPIGNNSFYDSFSRSPQPPSRSPAHAPGVDLLSAKAHTPVDWIADVHGCAFGDPTWMALIATLASTASLIVLHISIDDFVVDDGRPIAKAKPKAAGTATRGQGSPPAPPMDTEPGPVRVSATPELLALLRTCANARLPGIGSSRTRILVLLRDVGQGQLSPQVLSGVRMTLEAVLSHSFSGITCVKRLLGIVGGRRQQALAGLRAELQREMGSLGEAASAPLPCIETLRCAFRHFLDRLTLSGDGPVLVGQELETKSRTGDTLERLLSDAERQAGTNLTGFLFPVSESASRLARLKAQEKQLLEDNDGGLPDDAKIAELSAQLRSVEQNRRALLAHPLTPLVRFFVEDVLGEHRLRHGKVVEFANSLSAWLAPRMTPLMERRRQLLDERLRLSQQGIGGGEEGKKAQQGELATISRMLAEAERAIENFGISLDLFWNELAAVSDLAIEMKSVGVQPSAEAPDIRQLKKLYGEWAWNLSCPMQLLHGSPLQGAGQFLVEVLRDLGAEHAHDLYVISVIGIQSSAKSTLLNYLFGCGFATSAGRCTRGLYCSLMQCHGRTLLLLDTEGLMSLEAEGGDVFDAQLALMAMACSHTVLINHKGELSRQLQDLLEVCLFAMQHLKVCRIQPKLLFVLRDQHDRSPGVHADALRLMRKHLAEASGHLSLRLDELISLDPGSVFLLPSAFASDLDPHTGREVRWSTELFSHEALRLRQKIFREGGAFTASRLDIEGTPEFSTLPDWCVHAMSVWRVLDRYGPNLLHYKTIQEIEVQRELEELVKQISMRGVHGTDGFADQAQALLAESSKRLGEQVGQSSEQVDTEFRSSLQALLDRCSNKCQAELERALQVRKSKLPDVRKEEAKRKLQMPIEYQAELTRYTWTLVLTESVDRDQLRALKVHFKKTIEELWQAQASQSINEGQMKQIFASEWKAFEDKCKDRFTKTTRTRKQLAEEVCLIFNHVLRQHRHTDQTLHVLELIPATVLLSEAPLTGWDDAKLARTFLEVRVPARLAAYANQFAGRNLPRAGTSSTPQSQVETIVSPELRKHLAVVLSFDLPEGSVQMPSEENILQAIHRLNEAVQAEEDRFLSQIGVRFQGGRVAFLNVANVCLRHSVLTSLVRAEEQRAQHQWQSLQSHRQSTEEEFMGMVHRHTGDSERARMLAEMFFDALAREWLDETLVSVAADIRAHCLADMPDSSGAAERAYQQAFVERNWQEVLEYVLDCNTYLHKIFSHLFEDRKTSILRVQRPQLSAQLGSLFDALAGAAHRWGHREAAKRSKLSSFQATLRELAAEEKSRSAKGAPGGQPWSLLSGRFPVVADFPVEDPTRFASELSLHISQLLGKSKVDGIVGERLESALQKQQQQVWSLIRGCSAMCPCCGSKCDRTDNHTVHRCCHHLLPAFNGWRVAGTCEAALDTCKSKKNHDAPKRSDFSDHLFPNLEEYLKAEHPEWLPFPKEDRELLADSVLKAAWVNCRVPLLHRYDMVDCTPAEWIAAYEEPHRKLGENALELAEQTLMKFGYQIDGPP